MVIAIAIGSAVVFFKRAKKQTYKSAIVKPSDIKQQRKAKILDGADEEQNSFVVEEKYERVAWTTLISKNITLITKWLLFNQQL